MSQATSRSCPTCGTQVPGGQRFCSNCGTDLSRVEAASQYGGPPQQNFPRGQQVSPYTQSPYGQQQQPQFQYQPQYQQPQQSPQPRRGIAGWLVLLLIILLALLIGGSGLTYYVAVYQPGQVRTQATATAQRATNTAQTQANATATAQVQAQVNATATTQAQVQATSTALQTVYTQATSGTPVLNDSLASNSASRWSEYANGGGSCAFKGGKLHASGNASCFARATNFSDFAYQVQMTFVRGDGIGGIIFRFNNTSQNFYFFIVSPEGSYTFFSGHADQSGGLILKAIQSASTPAIKTGLNQSNQLAVAARGSKMYLYINQQWVYLVTDSSSRSGMIGVVCLKFGGASELAFSDAQVWKL